MLRVAHAEPGIGQVPRVPSVGRPSPELRRVPVTALACHHLSAVFPPPPPPPPHSAFAFAGIFRGARCHDAPNYGFLPRAPFPPFVRETLPGLDTFLGPRYRDLWQLLLQLKLTASGAWRCHLSATPP